MKCIVLFDFDGTITKYDSLIKFIRYAQGNFKFICGIIILFPMLIAYKLKFIPNYKAKELMISYFFKGMSKKKFIDFADEYSLKHIDLIVRQKAIEKINWHKNKGHKVVVVSASIDLWLSAWCKKNNLELIATSIEIKNNKLTGKFGSKNCYGIEKVNRIIEKYELKNFELIYAYGDSKGDKEMLNIADYKYYKYFN